MDMFGEPVEFDGYSKREDWLYSPEGRAVLGGVFENITRRAAASSTEAETSAVFEQELYLMLRNIYGIEPVIGKEKPVDGVVHTFIDGRSRRGHGRLDAVINNLVVEYKHHSKLKKAVEIEDACKQVEDYLWALRSVEGVWYDAILTDGLQISYFSHVWNELQHTPLRAMTVNDIRTVALAVLNNHHKKLAPQNILRDFSILSNADTPVRTLARVLFHQLMDRLTEKSAMLCAEWQSLIHLSVEDNGKSSDIEKRQRDLSEIFGVTIGDSATEYRALFALHTTYAILVKLIACTALDGLGNRHAQVSLADMPSPQMQQFFQYMEDGRGVYNNGVRNLLEGDFFSWYADAAQWCDAIWKALQPVIVSIEDYSAFSLNVRYAPVDIFKDLYMGIIPQSVRHSMGEYFTPEWLANSVIHGALEQVQTAEWKSIDPCCGSGIFIVSLIKEIVGDTDINRLSDEQREDLIHGILERVYGIDINPLAVLSARVGYYMAISQLGTVHDVEIPIYLGDSALVPTVESVDGIDCYVYEIHNLKHEVIDVVFPCRLVKDDCFSSMMDDIQAMVNTESEENIVLILDQGLTENERKSEQLHVRLQRLAHSLVVLHKHHWDGIWVRIIKNFMMVARLEHFQMIVGNPPWVKWEHLPAEYTRRIKKFCDIKHIFCNDGGMFGGAQLNICALISNVVATNWLDNDGVLAFLMPDSIMSQNSYEEFRNFYTDYSKMERLYLNKVDRWLPPLRPFKVGKKSIAQDFNTYYYSRKEADYRMGVPVREISKNREVDDRMIGKCTTWKEVSPLLTVKECLAQQMSAESTAFTYISSDYDFQAIIGESFYNYRTGVESTPFEIFKLVGIGPSPKGGKRYMFKNKQLKTSRYKVTDVPELGWDFDTRYIYPIVEGPSVKAFEFDTGNSYHIIPYEEDDTSMPVSMRELYIRSPEMARYFADHKYLLDKQSEKSKVMHRGSEFYALSKIGPYTFAPYMVAARDNSNFCASVIHPTLTPWGERKQSVCVKHTIIISQDIHGRFISDDEAHYINGVLNSSIVKAYIHSTFKTNGFSLKKSHIYLPEYRPDSHIQCEISSVSRAATADCAARAEASDILTRLYLELCRTRKD
ncbi:MAG: N-6 DNA methylase [Bacteroidales bacterium]|nr:N-6 DNA methylase [Bacteroidales bacterium]